MANREQFRQDLICAVVKGMLAKIDLTHVAPESLASVQQNLGKMAVEQADAVLRAAEVKP